MQTSVTRDRWADAQAAERGFWEGVNVPSLLAICAEKPAFLSMLDQDVHRELFADSDVLEILERFGRGWKVIAERCLIIG